jgi:hypothetical protein
LSCYIQIGRKGELNELLKREIYCYVFLLEIDSWVIAKGVGEDDERKARKGKKEVGVIQETMWE